MIDFNGQFSQGQVVIGGVQLPTLFYLLGLIRFSSAYTSVNQACSIIGCQDPLNSLGRY